MSFDPTKLKAPEPIKVCPCDACEAARHGPPAIIAAAIKEAAETIAREMRRDRTTRSALSTQMRKNLDS